jgi:hypothetical protein
MLPEEGEVIEVSTNFGFHYWCFVNRGTCRKCGEDVLWVETHNGKMCPVDLEPDEQEPWDGKEEVPF